MPTNQYLAFGTGSGANTLSNAAYAATAVRGTGYVAGEADAMHVNTVLRQASVGVAGTAKFATDYGVLDTLDDGSPTNFALALKSAVDTLIKLSTPTGSLKEFAQSTAPAGWLECDGSAVSRSTYAALFTAIGTTYGTGDGSTTFNLPDARGRVLRGWDHGAGRDAGRAFGSSQEDALQNIVGTLAVTDHGVSGVGSTTGAFQRQSGSGVGEADRTTSDAVTDNREFTFDASRVARTATETRVKSLAVLICVKT